MLSHYRARSSRYHRARRSSIAESVFRSPRFGHAVRWGNPWVATEGSAPVDDPEMMVVGLRAEDGAEVEIVGSDQQNLLDTPDMIRFWASESYLTEFMAPGTKVVLTEIRGNTGVVVMVSPGTDGHDPVVTIKEIIALGCGMAFRVTFTADLATLEDSYSCLHQQVKIDERALGSALDRDVLEAIFS